MTRIVIMAFSNDAVCFPDRAPIRLMKDGTAVAGPESPRASVADGLVRYLAEHGVRVEDIEEAEGSGCFAFVLGARQTTPEPSLALLRERLRAYGQSVGLTIRLQREDLFLAMHRI